MVKTVRTVTITVGIALAALLCCLGPASASEVAAGDRDVPVKGMVTMVAIGSAHCVPCKTMAPILNELKEEYAGRAAVITIDYTKEAQLAARFNPRVTPTLILFDRDGKEVKRHEGVTDKKSIVAMLNKAGAK